MREAVDSGVVLPLVEGPGDGSGAKCGPNSNLRWRGSAKVARFDNADSVGLPPRRFGAVDISGHGTGVYGIMVLVSTGTYW